MITTKLTVTEETKSAIAKWSYDICNYYFPEYEEATEIKRFLWFKREAKKIVERNGIVPPLCSYSELFGGYLNTPKNTQEICSLQQISIGADVSLDINTYSDIMYLLSHYNKTE